MFRKNRVSKPTAKRSCSTTRYGWTCQYTDRLFDISYRVISHEQMYLTVYPPCGPGSIPDRGEVFRGIFSWLEPTWQKMAQSPLSRGERPKSNYGQTMAEVKTLCCVLVRVSLLLLDLRWILDRYGFLPHLNHVIYLYAKSLCVCVSHKEVSHLDNTGDMKIEDVLSVYVFR